VDLSSLSITATVNATTIVIEEISTVITTKTTTVGMDTAAIKI
jgi:hypothetical protein